MNFEQDCFEKLYLIPSRNGIMRPSSVRGKGFKLINMGELFMYPRIRNQEMELVILNENEKINFGIENGDLLFARQSLVREGAGKVCIVINIEKPATFESHLIRVRLNIDKAHPLFYFYYFNSSIGYGSVQSIVNQVAAAGIRGSDLSRMSVLVPPLPIQRKIAAILSAYDELIENNNRRIAILEKMAEEIYREWFVRLRFPGYEKVKITKSVPKGWEVRRIGELVNRKPFGKIYRESELDTEGEVCVIDQSEKDFLGFYDGKAEHEASLGDPFILFGDHTCKMLLMFKPFSLAENVIPFKARNGVSILFLFYLIHNLIETTEYKRHWTELTNKSVLVPNHELQVEFAKRCKVFMVIKHILKDANMVLKKSRDLLLPRLISGKLDVEKLDIVFPPGMLSD